MPHDVPDIAIMRPSEFTVGRAASPSNVMAEFQQLVSRANLLLSHMRTHRTAIDAAATQLENALPTIIELQLLVSENAGLIGYNRTELISLINQVGNELQEQIDVIGGQVLPPIGLWTAGLGTVLSSDDGFFRENRFIISSHEAANLEVTLNTMPQSFNQNLWRLAFQYMRAASNNYVDFYEFAEFQGQTFRVTGTPFFIELYYASGSGWRIAELGGPGIVSYGSFVP